jgi:DNA-binding MarR family transcriptional regulator
MSDDAAFEALLQLHLTHARALRYVDGAIGGVHGLSTTELALLRAVGAAPTHGIRPTELARELHLTGSGVTRALLPLEKRGIVGPMPGTGGPAWSHSPTPAARSRPTRPHLQPKPQAG